MSDQRKLVLFAVCALLPLLLLVALPLRLSTNALLNASSDRVTDVSDASANSVNLQVAAISNLVTTYAQHATFITPPAMPTTDPANPISAELAELARSNSNIRAAVFIDRDGLVQGISPWIAANIGTSSAQRDYVIGALRDPGVAYVSEAYMARLPGTPEVIAVAHAVLTPASATAPATVAGVVVAAVDVTTTFQPYVNGFSDRRGISLSIYDQNRHLIAGPGATGQLTESGDEHLVVASGGQKVTSQTGSGDARTIAAYAPIGSTGWVAKATASGDEIFGGVRVLQTRVTAIAVILGLILFAGFVAFIRIMRNRSKVRRELFRSEARTRSIIQTAAQAFIEFDEDYRISEFNRQAELLFGWSREEALGQHMSVLQPVAMRAGLAAGVDRFMKREHPEGHAIRAESAIVRRGCEEPVPVDVTLWVTSVEGDKRLNCFVDDISERRRLDAERDHVMERQRELVEELRKADQAKGDFMSTVSHELRTPLTSIIGYLEMLQDGYGGELSERQGSMLDVVGRNSRRLLSLIEDLLTLSRMESGSFKLLAAPVDVQLLLSSAEQSFLPTMREGQIDLSLHVASDTGAVMGDAHQLERVILNVMSNAIKFTPAGGSVSVSAYRDADKVFIEVADTGIGIAHDEQKRLFNRFFRATSANENAIQGTGLGLAIVKGIVERHGGVIAVQSVLGEGTTVSVELPTAEASTMLQSSAALPANLG